VRFHAVRRLVAGTTVAALAVTGTSLATAPARAAAPNPRAGSAAGWLADQLTNGLVHNNQFDSDDHGLSLDVYLALQGLDARPSAGSSVIGALRADPASYVQVGGGMYAGAYGKLATAVELAGERPRSFGGLNLISDLEGLVVKTGDAAGRARDKSQYGDFSNTIGQAYVVRALARAHSDLTRKTTTYLLRQQCTHGFFRLTERDARCTTGRASVDTTALAVFALLVAKRNGATGLDDNLRRAGSWLVKAQKADGGYADAGVENTNSTGLAAAALRKLGRKGTAGNAAAWVAALQVDRHNAHGTKLRKQLGAIAFEAAAMKAGKRHGITVSQQDQWRRATAQAALGLAGLLPGRRLPMHTPHLRHRPGTKAFVRARGLQPGEHWQLAVRGHTVAKGVAGSQGRMHKTITLPRKGKKVHVVVTGSRANRHGHLTFRLR
jgi:hypothetical protein